MNNKQITGFVEYDGTDFPFLFDKGTLRLFPPTREIQQEQGLQIFERMKDNFNGTNKWIPHIKLQGIATDRKAVIFHTLDNPSEENGFLSFRVYDFCQYSSGSRGAMTFQNMSIRLTEANYFYGMGFHWKYEYDDNTGKPIIVPQEKTINPLVGTYLYKGIHVSVRLGEQSRISYEGEDFLTSITTLDVRTSKLIDYDMAMELVNHIRLFFCFLTRRRNIVIDEVEFWKKSRAKDAFGLHGSFWLMNQQEPEADERKSWRIISYPLVKKGAKSILQAIADNSLYLEHLPGNIGESSRHHVGEMLLNFAAFEREFFNLYGDMANLRSERYYNARQKACDWLEKESKCAESKKERRYYQDFAKLISNSGSSFEAKMSYALEQHKQVMMRYISGKYGNADKQTIVGICRRMNEIRNRCAHGRLDLRFEAVHILDLQILMILTYMMRLKDAGVGDDAVAEAIVKVF